MQKECKTELEEHLEKLKSKDIRKVQSGMRHIITLFSQKEDCSSSLDSVSSFDTCDNVNIKRMRNIVIRGEPCSLDSILTDIDNANPLVKSLAIRQAGYLMSSDTADLLVPLIKTAARNEDPYVRKSVALSFIKIDQNDPSLIENYSLIETIKLLLGDSNPIVAANAGSSVLEINKRRLSPLIKPPISTIYNLLTSLSDTNEWSCIQILDLTTSYNPETELEARGIIDRLSILPIRMNSAVMLSVARCCVKMTGYIRDTTYIENTIIKIIDPLISVFPSGPEVHLVILKSILVLLHAYTDLPNIHISDFYCKVDDSGYIKLAKIDIMITLANESNVIEVISELRKNTITPNTTISKKCVSEIGNLSLIYGSAAEECVECLIQLMNSHTDYIIQECVIASVNILRKYQFDDLIYEIFSHYEEAFDDPSSKAAILWIMSDHLEKIDNVHEIFDLAVGDTFLEEQIEVQLAALTTAVKLFIFNPIDGKDAMSSILTLSLTEVDNPEVKDKAYTYLMMLSKDYIKYSQVLSETIESGFIIEKQILNPQLVRSLMTSIGSIASTLGKFPDEISTSFNSEDSVIYPLLMDSTAKLYNIEIRGQFLYDEKDQRKLFLRIRNNGNTDLLIYNTELLPNLFGLSSPIFQDISTVPKKQTRGLILPVLFSKSYVKDSPSNKVEIQMKTNHPISLNFSCTLSLRFVLCSAEDGGRLSKEQFKAIWTHFQNQSEHLFNFPTTRIKNIQMAKDVLADERVFFFASTGPKAFFSGKTISGDIFVIIVNFISNLQSQMSISIDNHSIGDILLGFLAYVFQ